jgi:hypothetical protein
MLRMPMPLIVIMAYLVPSARADAQPLTQAEQAAVKEIEKLGARFDYVYDLKGFAKLISMSVQVGSNSGPVIEPAVAEDVLKKLKQLPRVTSLNLFSEIGDAGLAHLEGITQLESLTLTSSKVTDQGMKSVGRLSKLRTLELDCLALTDAGLRELHGLRDIERLKITHFDLSDAALAALTAKMPRLKTGKPSPELIPAYTIVKLPALMKPISLEVTPQDDSVRRLNKLRFNAAHEALCNRFQMFITGRALADSTFFREFAGMIDAVVRLEDFPERDLVLERSLAALPTIADIDEAQFKAGKIGRQDIARSRYERLTLELRVLKARQGKEAPK